MRTTYNILSTAADAIQVEGLLKFYGVRMKLSILKKILCIVLRSMCNLEPDLATEVANPELLVILGKSKVIVCSSKSVTGSTSFIAV